jgi:hypothetical protein
MQANKDFAVLVGKAFLQEIEAGHTESAIAFGRAFLLALGMKGPEPSKRNPLANTKPHAEWACAEN